jgi:hypothetical protein
MNSAQNYSRLDRVLYHVAFRGVRVQKALADIEDRLFLANFDRVSVEKPIFVTSLPRAGTTLILEVLTAIPELASHVYRDMPFVLCPLLWDRISRGVRRPSKLHERAHGDGMQVGYDSPEAFEEIMWKAFWPEKYLSDRITPWTQHDRDKEFEDFFHNHMRKIIALRSGGQRYISKNNANVARIDLLCRIFPTGTIIIPVRNPLSHSQSLLRQHLHFTNVHAQDEFGLRYMEWLGHYEFGATLRPIDFGQWIDKRHAQTPDTLGFWLNYWIAAHEYILSHVTPNVVFVDYDGLCADPLHGLGALANSLKIKDDAVLLGQASRFRAPTHYEDLQDSPLDNLVSNANDIYNKLQLRSLQYGGS